MFKSNKLKIFLDWIFWILLFFISFFSFGLAAKRPYNFVTIGLWICLGALFLFRHNWKGKVRFDLFCWLVLAFLIVQIVSCIVSIFTRLPTTPAVILLCNLLLYKYLQENKIDLTKCFDCVCCGGIAFLLLFAVIYRAEIIHPSFSQRIGTFFDNQNNVGRSTACIAILLASSAWRVKNIFLKLLFSIFALVSTYFLMLTGSVSAFMTMALVVLLVPPYFCKKRRIIVIIIEILAVILAFVALFTIPAFSYFAERIKGMFASLGISGGRSDGSFEDRFQGAVVGFRIFLNYPLTGNGYDSVYANFSITAHNNFSEVLADFGIFGFILEESFFIIPMYALWKKRWPNGQWFAPTLLFFFCFQLFLLSCNSKPDNLLITLCFASSYPAGCYPKFLKKRFIKTDKIYIR